MLPRGCGRSTASPLGDISASSGESERPHWTAYAFGDTVANFVSVPLRPPRLSGIPCTVAAVRSILAALLSALLLASHHTALTHALWHQTHDSGRHASAAVEPKSTHEHDEDIGQLCAFDAMLGQLLSGGATETTLQLHPGTAANVCYGAPPRLGALASIQPRSRGPPTPL